MVMCFADLPRVTYERSDHAHSGAGLGTRSAATVSSAVQEVVLFTLLLLVILLGLFGGVVLCSGVGGQ